MVAEEDGIWRQRLEDLFLHSPALLAILSGPEHVYQFVSERFLELIGHRDVLGKPVREALPGINRQGFGGQSYFSILDRVYASGQAFSGEELPARVTRPDGTSERRYFTVVFQPTHDSEGAVDGLLLHGLDVTAQVLARRQAERALVRERSSRGAADRAADRTSRLQMVTAALSEALTSIDVSRVVVEQGAGALEAQAASVVLLTDDGRELEVVYARGYIPDALHLYQRFSRDARLPLAAVVLSGEAIWIGSSDAWAERFPELLLTHERFGYEAAAALPLVIDGRPVGAIGLSFAQQRTFDAEDRVFMTALAQQCAQALDRAKLYEAKHRAAALLDLAHDAIMVRDQATSVIQFWNEGAEQLYGWTREEALGEVSYELLQTQFPRPLPHIEAQVVKTGRWEGELVQTARDGRRIMVSSRWALERGQEGRPNAILTIDTNITEQKGAQDALAHLALHDTLTGLPNRLLFHDRLQQALQLGHRDGEPVALLLMDLVHFKEVNDAFGHHAGDFLLRQVSTRLQQVLRRTDTVARLGGDEFAIILPKSDSPGAIEAAQKIAAGLGEPFPLAGHQVRIGPSIGIALYPEHGQTAGPLLRHADVAMYAAKRAGRTCAVYSPEQDASRRTRSALTGELRHAIGHDELILQYQPEVNIKTGRPDQIEALIRWRHPRHGLLLPDTFIPLAEETGLIEPLTRWALTTALQACQRWQEHAPEARVAVNISTASLHDPDLAESIARTLRQAGMAASTLTLELTEGAIMTEPERAMRILTALHEMGIAIALDDFGTGSSSLAHLKRLPVDQIKIDRSFVRDIASNQSDAAIVRSVIDLGHILGRVVTAEGVEDDTSCRLLASMGCDLAQGDFVTPPLGVSELIAVLRSEPRLL